VVVLNVNHHLLPLGSCCMMQLSQFNCHRPQWSIIWLVLPLIQAATCTEGGKGEALSWPITYICMRPNRWSQICPSWVAISLQSTLKWQTFWIAGKSIYPHRIDLAMCMHFCEFIFGKYSYVEIWAILVLKICSCSLLFLKKVLLRWSSIAEISYAILFSFSFIA